MSESLKRGLFGFRGSGVREALAERERAIRRLTEDAQTAQTRASDLEAVLEATREELATARADIEELDRGAKAADERAGALEAELESAKAEALEHGGRARRAELEVTGLQMEIAAVRGDLLDRETRIRELEAAGASEPQGVTVVAETPSAAELNRILGETQEAITRLLGDARSASERELAEAERRREELRAEIERLVAWRDEMAPLANEVRSLIGEAQARTGELDDRLRSVLEPMTTTIGSLHGRLAELLERTVEGPTDVEPATAPMGTPGWGEAAPAVVQVDEDVEVETPEEVEHPTRW